MAPLKQGASVGRYRVGGLLLVAGGTVVYEAYDPDADRPVALKVVPSDLSRLPAVRRRFRRDASKLAGLEHPSLPRLYEAGSSTSGLYAATALVHGETLDALLEEGPLPARRALELLGPIADALDRLHANGVLHGELSAAGIVVSDDGRAFLVGAPPHVGELVPAVAGSTRSVAHAAPEPANGQAPGPRSDVYSLATIVFTALTGTAPFGDGRGRSTHADDAPARASSLVPDLPPALDGVLTAAMAKEPGRRPASGGELMRLVELAFDPVEEPPGTEAGAAQAAPRRAITSTVLITAGLALIAASGGWLLSGLGRDAPNDPAPAASRAAQSQADAALSATFSRLNRRTGELQRTLRTARTRDGQARTAAALAREYRLASRSLGRSKTTLGKVAPTGALFAALGTASGAYDRLGDAARAGNARRFATSADQVRRAEAGVRREAARLGARG